MAYIEILSSIFGGAIGGGALVSLIFKQLIDHKLNEHLKVFDFVLQNRTRVSGEILGSMGLIISAARQIALDTKYVPQHNEALSHATVDLEDHLRPAYVLLTKKTYDEIHNYKKTAESLLRAYYFLTHTHTPKLITHDEINAIIIDLESKRQQILNSIGGSLSILRK